MLAKKREGRIMPNMPSTASTISELLHWRALQQPIERVYSFVADRGGTEQHLTFEELDRRARAIGAALYSLQLSGKPVLLLYPPGITFGPAFFGCLYAGVIAVPVYPPKQNRSIDRLLTIVADTQASVALTTGSILSDLLNRPDLAPELAAMHWIGTDEIASGSESGWQAPTANAADVAFVQYTSGSTSKPRGVVLTHANLMHNLALIQHAFQATPEDVGVFWLPIYHDMGLIGCMLQPVYVGARSVLMSPVDFLQRPVRWLEEIGRHKATITAAPNFAYELCIRRISPDERSGLDLSTLQLAVCGAETNRLETINRFADVFTPCGFRRQVFYPCYGLAENTLIVTGGARAAQPVVCTVERSALEQQRVVEASHGADGTKTFVGCGRLLLDEKVIIVDPQARTRSLPGEIGEIWVAGGSVGQGYWNRSDDTEHYFHAYLSDGSEGPFLRTGDLGFLQNGELYVTGRCKDLIIINGRNFYPQDIELTVSQSHPALRSESCAAFSIELSNEEQLVIVQEVERTFNRNLAVDEVVGTIRAAIAASYEVQARSIVLVESMSIPRTSSGKIQRHVCQSQFLAGVLKVVSEWRAVEPTSTEDVIIPSREAAVGRSARRLEGNVLEIERWLVWRIAAQLGIESSAVDIRRPFTYYGLSSLQAVNLATELEAWLGRPLSPTLAYDYPNIEKLSQHLALDADEAETTGIYTPATAARRSEVGPVAIIGIGCRFPGARGPEEFWQLLRNGVDCITEIPAERRELYRFRNTAAPPDELALGFPQWGGFLEGIDQFDFGFFGITPREAAYIDPQQRLLLETAWQALEDAGQAADRLSGSQTGVFVGISTSDYGQLQLSNPQLDSHYATTGTSFSIAANRISYIFGFSGPSLALDTACSSSLVAVHLACESLRRGECTLALAGGVNIMLFPAVTMSLARGGFMASDGRCKAFDARADGYVRSEGVGVVVLKLLSAALADNDPVYAVILGSAVNNDGRTNGLTAPNRQAQEAVLREAYRQAGVSPGRVDYVEAHGTGTQLGDPIEVAALGAVLSEDRPPGITCALGSVKTNIGHLEAAAGIAGLIKTALALKYREIPPSLHYQEPNPHIRFDRLPVHVQESLSPWPDRAGPAVAGVSSFGFGGTNAHVVVQEAPVALPAPMQHSEWESDSDAHLLALSANSGEAIQRLARAYLDHLDAEQKEVPARLADICYSSAVRRSHQDHRLALVVHTQDEAREMLQAYLDGGFRRDLVAGRNYVDRRRQVAFVFSGQGPQWWAMGRQLLDREQIFRDTLQDVPRALRRQATWSLMEELQADKGHSRLDQTEIAQPALFAIQVALAALWHHWGIVPGAVVGHSMGEVAAAYVAGALTLEDAARVIVHRGRLQQRAHGQGMMVAVELPAERVMRTLAGYEARLSIAALNGPSQTVLSGDADALGDVIDLFGQQGILCQQLNVQYAFHSAQMEPFQDELGRALDGLRPQSAIIPIFSTLTGEATDGPVFDSTYWQRQMKEPVRFAAAISHLMDMGFDLFLEMGPHPVLATPIKQCLRERGEDGTVLPSLRRDEEERVTMLRSLGTLYSAGCKVAWSELYPRGRFVRLPAHPWQREHCWLEPEGAAMRFGLDHGNYFEGRQGHPLLGNALDLAHKPDDHIWENRLSRRLPRYVEDHKFQGAVVLPGAAYLEMGIAAATEILQGRPFFLSHIELRAPLFLPKDGACTVQFAMSFAPDGIATFRIFSHPHIGQRSEFSWTLHAQGEIRLAGADLYRPSLERLDVGEIQRCSETEVSGESYYETLSERGFQYGPSFQGIKHLWRNDEEALGQVQLPQVLEGELEDYRCHPALLDACAQVLVAIDAGNSGRLFLPTGVDEVRWFERPGPRLWSYARLQPDSKQSEHGLVGDVWLLTETGEVVLEARGLSIQYLDLDGMIPRAAESKAGDLLYTLEWERDTQQQGEQSTPPAESITPKTWFVFADTQGVGEALAAAMTREGHRAILISAGERYARIDEEHFRIRLCVREDITRVFEASLGNSHPPCDGVVYLWGLDMRSSEEITPASLEADQQLGAGTVVPLVQGLVQAEWDQPARLWLVTQGAQKVADDPVYVAPTQGMLWGLGRTVGQEHPGMWGGLLDLEPQTPIAEASAQLWTHIRITNVEDQIAFRGRLPYVARLVRERPSPQLGAGIQWRADGRARRPRAAGGKMDGGTGSPPAYPAEPNSAACTRRVESGQPEQPVEYPDCCDPANGVPGSERASRLS
jgi:phthiocerol/phenolphthiocerol synthesis type-I polyketide synthase C